MDDPMMIQRRNRILEAFLTHVAEITRQDKRLVQQWRNLQQLVPKLKEAWEKGQTLFREALERAKSDQEDMEYFSMIEFAVDCYAYLSASRIYPDNPSPTVVDDR